MMRDLLTLTVLCLVYEAASQGQRCTQNGVSGVCTVQGKCLSNPQSQEWNWRCGLQMTCCVATDTNTTTTTTTNTTTTNRPVATTPRLGSTTTEYIPPEYDYLPNIPMEEGCSEPAAGSTVPKTGRKAWDKCIEYQEDLIYPCKPSVAVSGNLIRQNNCKQGVDSLIVGGANANPDEFPHMVLLGYGPSSATATWLCGGTLLSEKFILTAGHCTYVSRGIGPVTYAIVGSLKRSDNVDSSQVYRIQNIIKHPQYKAPSKYHDIALLETLVPIILGPSAVPACLDIFGGDQSRAVATGWGAFAWKGSNADTLQKVTLTKFKEHECEQAHHEFKESRTLPQGYNATTQICYGDYAEGLDTCQGDSGGPLTIPNPQVQCMYVIVGITSSGKKCGNANEPGIYTKLSYYVPWVESVVWPSE